MFFLERDRESIDDRTENFQEFSNSVEALGFIDERVKDVVDVLTSETAQIQKLAIDAMQNGLQEVPLSRIFRVKIFEQLEA